MITEIMEPIILSIVGVKNTSDCYINLSNGESIRCSIDLVSKYYLKESIKIDTELMKSIIGDQRLITVKKSAYRYSTYKPRSSYQVQEKLKLLGYDKTEIEVGVNFLIQFNLLDDLAYAKNYIKNRAKSKKFGKSRIIIELKKLGINEYLIESAIVEDYDEDSTYSDAKLAFDKKIRLISNKPVEKQKRSVIDYLARRGFTWNIINQIIKENFNSDNQYL